MGAVAGSQLEDKYFIQKVKLGQGSFGVVWRGIEKSSGTSVAVKQMDKAQLPKRGVRREDIEREVSVMKVVRHDNILRLFDFCEDSQYISFVLEYCEGGDFGDKVKERGSSVTEEEACRWMSQICAAIRALHGKDVCHRDIKPDNFMISRGDARGVIKLADFGLATILPKGKLLTEKCGTPAFMAPEQMNPGKARGYNHSVDMWAAGITMFMLMSGGKHPFVDAGGKLDERKLGEGRLDFEQQGVMAFFGQSRGFSDAARDFCRKLVNPNAGSRVTADIAIKDQWLALALRQSEGAASVRRSSEQAQISRAQSAGMPGGQQLPGSSPANSAAQPGLEKRPTWPINIGGGFFGLFGDQNAPPSNAQTESDDQAKEAILGQRIEALQSQIAVRNQDPHGIHQENSALKKQIEELQVELKVQKDQTAARRKARSRTKDMGGYPADAASSDATVRDPARISKQMSGMPGKVPMTSVTAANASSGMLPPGLKVLYKSSTANCWLNATVTNFNETDSTYNVTVRQHADLENIKPDPNVSRAEAWPPGSFVNYQSSTAGRWLAAVVVSYVEGSGDANGTYNLDVRDCAEVDRIRPRCQ